MEDCITRVEHEEFARRMEDEHSRQNKRIELLEESTTRIATLSTSIEKLAVNIQVRQGERLEVLESRDGEMWRKVTAYAVTMVVGIIIGYISTRIGF